MKSNRKCYRRRSDSEMTTILASDFVMMKMMRSHKRYNIMYKMPKMAKPVRAQWDMDHQPNVLLMRSICKILMITILKTMRSGRNHQMKTQSKILRIMDLKTSLVMVMMLRASHWRSQRTNLRPRWMPRWRRRRMKTNRKMKLRTKKRNKKILKVVKIARNMNKKKKCRH